MNWGGQPAVFLVILAALSFFIGYFIIEPLLTSIARIVNRK